MSDNLKELTVRSPGRINLIGEHTDYNDGLAMPAAVDKEILLTFSPSSSKIVITSEGFGSHVEIDPESLESNQSDLEWIKYFRGALILLSRSGFNPGVFKCNISSTIPAGSGMSSSAAITCGFIYGLDKIHDFGLSRWEIAKMAQQVEHEFIGLPCGIMDQFANLFSEEDHFQILDCRDLHVKKVPRGSAAPVFFLCNSKVRHSLAETEYGVRKEECEQALQMLKSLYPRIKSLRDVTAEQLAPSADSLGPLLYNRVKYLLEENSRVEKMADAIVQDDWITAGHLLYEGHFGLRDLYNVSCSEIDHLVDLALEQSEILGARMMGGGFGGCTINIAESDNLEHVFEFWRNSYHDKFGLTPEFYSFDIEKGTSIVGLPD